MKILSLDTAMAACSAAIIDTQVPQPLAAAFVPMERGHAEALPPMVAEVVKASGIGLHSIDRIVVTTGPGTFTGVRIGLAFARGLGMARGIPVIGIDTLSAISANETADVPLLVVADARNAEVYAAVLDADRKLTRAPHVTSAAAAAAEVRSGTLVLGTAAPAVIAASGAQGLIHSRAGDVPVASCFALLAMGVEPGAMPSPLYLRSADAKPQVAPLRQYGELAIDAAGPSAAELLSSLHAEAFEEGWSAQAFAEMLQSPGTHAAFASDSGEPLGFIVTRSAADEAEIITIGSRVAAQRRGVARQLLEHHMALLAASGIRHLFLEVAASNVAAQALYASCGFTEAGRRKGYYKLRGGLEDAIVMRRGLHP